MFILYSKPDLIIGAPFYFDKDSGGAVYIYMNNDNYCLKCNPPIRLFGKPESRFCIIYITLLCKITNCNFLKINCFRFGFAITNLGDLNKDGYEDIAIGAPYEGNGVIYVYLGSAQGIVTKPSQVS